jgi:hypothetical protein
VARQLETLHITKKNSKIVGLRSFTRGVHSTFWSRQIGGRAGKLEDKVIGNGLFLAYAVEDIR